jgi:hypothetical protein
MEQLHPRMALGKTRRAMMPLSGEGNQLFLVANMFLLFAFLLMLCLLTRIRFTEQGNFAATYDREGC